MLQDVHGARQVLLDIERGRLAKEMFRYLTTRVAEAEKEIRTRIQTPWSLGKKEHLQRRSGTLLNSIMHEVKMEGLDVSGLVGPDPQSPSAKYQRVQEEGKTILGKKTKLTIPQGIAMTNQGVKKFAAKNAKNAGFPFIRFFKKGRGTLMAGRRRGTRRFDKLFFLVDSVTIPPRPYVKPTTDKLTQDMQEFVENFLDEMSNPRSGATNT